MQRAEIDVFDAVLVWGMEHHLFSCVWNPMRKYHTNDHDLFTYTYHNRSKLEPGNEAAR